MADIKSDLQDQKLKIEKKSQGKFLGSIAFWVSEFLVVLSVITILLETLNGNEINYSFAGSIFVFQGTIFVTTWGAKASSNFAKKNDVYEQNRIS